MSSLKDQLLKAGFKQTPKPEKPKPKKIVLTSSLAPEQKHRTFCENCKNILPDVELYQHRNPDVTGKWICTDCADKNWISDDLRKTAQSEASRSGIFKRAYGKTHRGVPS